MERNITSLIGYDKGAGEFIADGLSFLPSVIAKGGETIYDAIINGTGWKPEPETDEALREFSQLLPQYVAPLATKYAIKGFKTGIENYKDARTFIDEGEGPFGTMWRQKLQNPKQAVKFLEKQKEGEIINFAWRKGYGDISLPYGENTAIFDIKKNEFIHKGQGLKHILDKHPDFNLNKLSQIIKDGIETGNDGKRVKIEKSKNLVAFRLDYDNIKKNWIITAFKVTK